MSAGVYIHIPFCVKKCLYCDFVSACGSGKDMDKYQKALINEMKLTKICGQADSVFFGGGTPSVYPVEHIAEIIEVLKQKSAISKNAEMTIEVNPGTVDMSKLKSYLAMGINRLSIGLQSADNTELKALGRIHDYYEFLSTFENARSAGFDNINVDLMSAIPGQTITSYENTLRKVVSLNPEHISAYSLIIEEGTPFYELYGEMANSGDEENTGQMKISSEDRKSAVIGHTEKTVQLKLPSEDEEREMYYLTKKYLAENGYARYEISNYSKPGYECRHNIKYWSRNDYYGFGTAAASLVNNERYVNTQDRKYYIQENGNPQKIKREHMKLTISEQMEEFMFLGLRKTDGVSYVEFKDYFGRDMDEIYKDVIEKEVKNGLLIKDEKKLRVYLSERGIDMSNMVMAEFLFCE